MISAGLSVQMNPTTEVCDNICLLAHDLIESENSVWMRSCPQCNIVLLKFSLYETQRCACGWEWLS
jgi:hypothetical protein